MAKTSVSLPSIKVLLSDSWEIVRSNWWGMVRITLITFALQVVLVLAALAVFAFSVGSGFFESLRNSDPSMISSAVMGKGALLGGLLLVWFVLMVVVGMAGQIGLMLFAAQADEGEEEPGARETYKASFRYVGPLFVVGLITMFLVTGGFFALIIPGIIFSLLFSFVTLEVLLNAKSPVAAVRRSVGLVGGKLFGPIMLRWIVLFLINMGIGMVFSLISGGGNEDAGGLVQLFSIVVNIAMSLFAIAYTVTLYRQVIAVEGTEKEGSLTWVILIAAIGWILGGWLIYKTVTSEDLRNFMNELGTSSEPVEFGDEYLLEDLDQDFALPSPLPEEALELDAAVSPLPASRLQ